MTDPRLADAIYADETIDRMVAANKEGVSLFTEQDGERFVNVKLVDAFIVSASMIHTLGGLNERATELIFTTLAALSQRAKGTRLEDLVK